MFPKFTSAPGRVILRDGERFAVIGRCGAPDSGAGPAPADVDAFTRAIPAAFYALECIARDGLPVVQTRALARQALALLDWKKEG